MEAVRKVSTRLTWIHKAFVKTKLLSRGYMHLLHRGSQRCILVHNRIVWSQICQKNSCASFLKASCLKTIKDQSYNVTWTINRSSLGVTLTVSTGRSFSERSDRKDLKDFVETQKEFSKSKTESVKSVHEDNHVNKTAEVLSSVVNDDTHCDTIDNDVLKADGGLRLEDTVNTLIKPSLRGTSENGMKYAFDNVRTTDIASNTVEGKYRSAVYGEDSDSSESDDDTDGDDDLFSDSDSDSSDSNLGNSYCKETAGSKDHMSEGVSVVDDLELLHKEGFTTEEMIAQIEQSHEITEDLNDDCRSFHDESDHQEEEEICDVKGNIVTSEHSSNSDVQPISQQSRHFDKDGVISFLDSEDEKSKSRDWSVKEIEDFVNIAVEPVEELPWQPPVSLERGKQGVFDIEDLVLLVRNENLLDIVTLRIPSEKHFGDYMVIATAKSLRHMRAVCETVNWVYKQRKSTSEKFLKQEGKQDDSGWIALDLGNIILHIFLKEERELYDLEMLWLVGSAYDDQCQEQEDPYALSLEDHPWLKELEDLKNKNTIEAGHKK